MRTEIHACESDEKVEILKKRLADLRIRRLRVPPFASRDQSQDKIVVYVVFEALRIPIISLFSFLL